MVLKQWGALGDDCLHRQAIPGLDVLLGEHLTTVFVAQTARAVSSAHLVFAQGGKRHLRLGENLHHRPVDLLLPLVVAARAAHEEQVLVRATVAPLGNREVLGPLVALLLVETPGVSRALHALEHPLNLGWEVRLHLNLEAAHVRRPSATIGVPAGTTATATATQAPTATATGATQFSRPSRWNTLLDLIRRGVADERRLKVR